MNFVEQDEVKKQHLSTKATFFLFFYFFFLIYPQWTVQEDFNSDNEAGQNCTIITVLLVQTNTHNNNS